MKQELKETEGSPELRARQRQRQRQIASSRMMAAIERADVVLANPEHYSVAIRYDPQRMSAPIILAKGADEVALRIREVAKEHEVPIAQIPALARYLFNQLDIGESIPAPLFEAIAMVLAWAYEVKDTGMNKDLPPLENSRPASVRYDCLGFCRPERRLALYQINRSWFCEDLH